jgi:hypothetical protein
MHPERRPNPDRSPEALAARLRALPQPPIPAGLEARLLAAIPPVGLVRRAGTGQGSRSARGTYWGTMRRRWAVWAGVIGAVAAACLLAVLGWRGRDGRNPIPNPKGNVSVRRGSPQPPDDSARGAWREARRVLDGGEPAPFAWPLPQTTPRTFTTSIPAALFD